jgi:hypothetical protein
LTEWIESPSEKYTLRNAYQWLAMATMTMDHVGYLYDIPALRYFGRLAMPLYAILFVMTVRSGHVHLGQLFWLAAASQLQAMYVVDLDKLNIIFGFWIFGWTVQAFERRNWLDVAAGLMMMLIPVSYDWYLYATMFIFYCLREKYLQAMAFAVATAAYTYLMEVHLRQLLAMGAPFIQGIKAPRPNKYLYRYFYPGHLVILAILKYLQMHGMM